METTPLCGLCAVGAHYVIALCGDAELGFDDVPQLRGRFLGRSGPDLFDVLRTWAGTVGLVPDDLCSMCCSCSLHGSGWGREIGRSFRWLLWALVDKRLGETSALPARIDVEPPRTRF